MGVRRGSLDYSSGATCLSSMPKALSLISSTETNIKINKDLKGQPPPKKKYWTRNSSFAKGIIPPLLPHMSCCKAQIRTCSSGRCSWRGQVAGGQQRVSGTCQESQGSPVCRRLFWARHICRLISSLPHTSHKRKPGGGAHRHACSQSHSHRASEDGILPWDGSSRACSLKQGPPCL